MTWDDKAWGIASRLLEENGHPSEDTIKSACDGDLDLAEAVMQCIEAYTLGDQKLERSLPRIGLKIGNYELQDRIDEGGFGTVWLAIDHETSRKAAVKFLKQQVRDDVFLSEFQILDRLGQISGVVDLYGHDHVGDRRCLILEFIEGTRLDRLLSSHPDGLPVETVRAYLKQLLNIVEKLHTHKKQVVHGDLTPRNIIIDQDNNLNLIDFGVSFHSGTRPSGHSHDYRVPEIAVQHTPTMKADLFQIGLLGYEMLTGRRYWETTGAGEGSGSCCALVADRGVPKQLADTLKKALVWNPEDRWESASDFKQGLLSPPPASTQSQGAATEDKSKSGVDLKIRSGSLRTTVGILAAVILLCVLFLVIWIKDSGTVPHNGIPVSEPTSTKQGPNTASVPDNSNHATDATEKYQTYVRRRYNDLIVAWNGRDGSNLDQKWRDALEACQSWMEDFPENNHYEDVQAAHDWLLDMAKPRASRLEVLQLKEDWYWWNGEVDMSVRVDINGTPSAQPKKPYPVKTTYHPDEEILTFETKGTDLVEFVLVVEKEDHGKVQDRPGGNTSGDVPIKIADGELQAECRLSTDDPYGPPPLLP